MELSDDPDPPEEPEDPPEEPEDPLEELEDPPVEEPPEDELSIVVFEALLF